MSIHLLCEHLCAIGKLVVPALLETGAKGVVILLLTCLAALALRRASAAARHLVWFLGTLCLLVLPLLTALLPGLHVLPRWSTTQDRPPEPASAVNLPTAPRAEMPPSDTQLLPNYIPPHAAVAPAGPAVVLPPKFNPTVFVTPAVPLIQLNCQAWVLLAWLGGVVLCLSYLLVGCVSLVLLRRRCSEVTDAELLKLLRESCDALNFHRPVHLLCSPRRAIPMTWGILRTWILLPAESSGWTVEQRRAVLLHELSHAKRLDCQTQLIAKFACALHWFNPLAWFAQKQMQAEREQACDDRVLSAGTQASAYAEQLLKIASEMSSLPFSTAAIAMARPGRFEGRLLAILDVKRNRRAVTWTAAVAALVLMAAISAPLAMLRAQEVGPAQKSRAPATAPGLAQLLDGRGRVVDVQGKPIAGAQLQSMTPKWSAITDKDGWFAWPKLDSGEVDRVTVRANGFFERENVSIGRSTDGKVTWPKDGEFELHRSGKLEGIVLGQDGKPVASAPLSISWTERYQGGTWAKFNAVQAKTDAQGHFAFGEVPPGDLLLYTLEPVQGINIARPIQLSDGQVLRDVVLDLSRCIAVARGRVIDSQGKPLANAQVALCWHNSHVTGCAFGDGFWAKTNSKGEYQLQALPTGAWHIWASIGRVTSPPVPVTLSDIPVQAPDVVMPVVQTAKGRVRPVAPMDVEQTVREWIDATAAGDAGGVEAVVIPGSVFARNSGQIANLIPQIKQFTMTSVGGATSTPGMLAGEARTNDLDLGNGRRESVTFKLIGTDLHYRITDVVDEKGVSLVAGTAPSSQPGHAAANTGPTGGLKADAASLATIEVEGRVVDDQTGEPVTQYTIQRGFVDPKDPSKVSWGGEWTSSNLPRGEFQNRVSLTPGEIVRFRILAAGYLPEPITPAPLKGPAETKGLVVRLKKGADLHGRVLDYAGKPVAGAMVISVGEQALEIADGRIGKQTENLYQGSRTTTDADGRFVLGGCSRTGSRIVVAGPMLNAWLVPADQMAGDLTIQLPQPAGLTIHYDIEGSNQTASIFAELHTWDMPGWKDVRLNVLHRVHCPQGGEIIISNVTPGTYDIARQRDLRIGDAGSGYLCDRTFLTLKPGEHAVVDFVRKTGQRVTGKVAGLEGTNCPGAMIRVCTVGATGDVEDPKELKRTMFDAVTCEKDGAFTTSRLSPGKYTVLAEAYEPEHFNGNTGWRLPSLVATAELVVPETGDASPVQLQLKPLVRKTAANPAAVATLPATRPAAGLGHPDPVKAYALFISAGSTIQDIDAAIQKKDVPTGLKLTDKVLALEPEMMQAVAGTAVESLCRRGVEQLNQIKTALQKSDLTEAGRVMTGLQQLGNNAAPLFQKMNE
jgi:beta-lactamase regulating signal transducer with metallopeptidase domain/uncharacterized GH25 family protein